MTRGNVRRPSSNSRLAELSELRRHRFTAVRRPDDGRRLDEVVVCASGVHVITRCDALEPASMPKALVLDAEAAAVALRSLLPARYRDRVRPVLCPAGNDELGEWAGDVLIASPPTLAHVMRSLPVVLSTSEVAELGDRLARLLEPFPDGEPPARQPWYRRGRILASVAALMAVAVAAAVGSGAVDSGFSLPW